MEPYAILMFCFSGALLLYAALLAVTRDHKMLPRSNAVKVKDGRAYALRVAKIVAFVAVAPFHSGIVAQFSLGWAVAVLIAEIILWIWVGTLLFE